MLEAKLPPPRPAVAADQHHQPERRLGMADEIGECNRRNEQHRRAEDRPVAAAERRDHERVGKPHQRADQSGQRHELKQLVGRVVEAGRRQLGGDDAPDQPDRKADMLGNDRPDEIAPGDKFALGFPEFRILWVPVRNPACVLAHRRFPFVNSVGVAPVDAPPRRFLASCFSLAPTKKPQPEARAMRIPPGQRRCLSARHWTNGAARGGADRPI